MYDRPDAISPFGSWEAAFAFLAPLASDERLVVVLDEFTYLVESSPSLPSVLQRLWDARLRHTHIMLIVCGSYVGLIEQHVLGYRAPLYGRRTGKWQVQPLDGECKWALRPVGTNILDDLRARSAHIQSLVGARRVHYALFARAGFTAEMVERAEAEGIILVGLSDLVDM